CAGTRPVHVWRWPRSSSPPGPTGPRWRPEPMPGP
ncbi:MAG: hypothetical protein AVDCRST_MAG20-1681, partial [uncultured Acidimicrobiales bacterium]